MMSHIHIVKPELKPLRPTLAGPLSAFAILARPRAGALLPI